MKTGKNIIYKYCETTSAVDIDHIEKCRDILNYLKEDNIDLWKLACTSCPSCFGLDDFIGDCFKQPLPKVIGENKEQMKQCQECWEKALE